MTAGGADRARRLATPSERCAPASERRDDPLFATAPPAERFVLVEQPGAWGRSAVGDWRHRHPAVASLLARCRGTGTRLLLVRRLHREPSAPRRWAVADARPGHEAMWWGTFDDLAELAGLDPLRPDGTRTTEPAVLVCTHGRRDPCCAQRGWPVVTALTASRAEWTWQCSHVGGDRFAANLVVLPHGLYHGRVTPTAADEIVRSYLRGHLHLPTLRGRSAYPTAVQAAQHYAREALGVDAIDALRPLAVERPDDRTVEIRLATDSGQVRVVLAFHDSPPIPRVTCSAGEPSSVLVWELRTLESADV